MGQTREGWSGSTAPLRGKLAVTSCGTLNHEEPDVLYQQNIYRRPPHLATVPLQQLQLGDNNRKNIHLCIEWDSNPLYKYLSCPRQKFLDRTVFVRVTVFILRKWILNSMPVIGSKLNSIRSRHVNVTVIDLRSLWRAECNMDHQTLLWRKSQRDETFWNCGT
jgi:hypothetical protein